MHQQLKVLDAIQEQIKQLEARIVERIQVTPTLRLIQTIPRPALASVLMPP